MIDNESDAHQVYGNKLDQNDPNDTATEDMSMSMRQDYHQRSEMKNNENSQGMLYSPRGKKNGMMTAPKLNRIQQSAGVKNTIASPVYKKP